MSEHLYVYLAVQACWSDI